MMASSSRYAAVAASVLTLACTSEEPVAGAIDPATLVSTTSTDVLLDPGRIAPPWQVVQQRFHERQEALRIRIAYVARYDDLGLSLPARPPGSYGQNQREVEAWISVRPDVEVHVIATPDLIEKHIESGLFSPEPAPWTGEAGQNLRLYTLAGSGLVVAREAKLQCRNLFYSNPDEFPNPHMVCQIWHDEPRVLLTVHVSSHLMAHLPEILEAAEEAGLRTVSRRDTPINPRAALLAKEAPAGRE